MSREPFKKEFTYLARYDAFLGRRQRVHPRGGVFFYSRSRENKRWRNTTIEGHFYSERVTLDPTRGSDEI